MMRKLLGDYRGDILTCAGAVLFGCIALVLVLQLWKADLNVPLYYGAPLSEVGHTDRMGYFQHVKSIHDVGGTLDNPYLGAPVGLNYRPYPQHEILHFGAMRVISWFSPGWAQTVNLYFLLAVPLTILTSYIAGRALGVARIAAAGLAVLFAFQPYHFLRGMDHLVLGSYYQVPLGIMICVWVWLGRPLILQYRPLRLSGYGWAALLIGAMMGAGNIYYASFTMMFLGAGWVLRAVRRRRIAAGVDALLPIASIILVVVLQMLPTIQYKLTTDEKTTVTRYLADAEVYGLKITQMLLPVPGHRIGAFSRLIERYNQNTLVTENMASSLGFAGAVGFVLLLLWVLRCRSRYADPRLTGALADMNLIAVLYATFGGFTVLVALFLGSYLRSVNRMSIFIAFFALLAIAQLAGRYLDGSRLRRTIGVVVITAVVVLGVLDQTTSGFVPGYAADQASFTSDQRLVSQIEASVPAGAMIYQLPYVPFPEAVLEDYQLFRGYLHSKQLHWSYGSIRGTTADQWAWMISKLGPAEMVKGLREQGFAGIYIDRKQMPDDAEFETRLAGVLGAAPIVSQDGRLAFYRFP